MLDPVEAHLHHLVERAVTGRALPAEATALREGITALAHARRSLTGQLRAAQRSLAQLEAHLAQLEAEAAQLRTATASRLTAITPTAAPVPSVPPFTAPRCRHCGEAIEDQGDPCMCGGGAPRWVHHPGRHLACDPATPGSTTASPRDGEGQPLGDWADHHFGH